MSCSLSKIPMKELGDAGALFGAYLGGGAEAIENRIGGFSLDDLARVPRSGGRGRDADMWGQLCDRLAEFNERIGVAPDLVARMRDGARVVITGQQPGALGGPLMTLYKIAAAAALAEAVEARLGTPCVPLYWMGADDIDFAEIRDVVLTADDLTPYAAAIPSNAHKVGQPVGDIAIDAVAGVWEALAPHVGGLAGAAHVTRLVETAIAASSDHGEMCARLVAGLTGGKVVVVDGREPLLRRCAGDLVLNFFDDEDTVRHLVTEDGKALSDAGYHAQLELGPDSGVFLLRDGLRQKIPDARRAIARAEIVDDVGTASPGVVLRTLIQDVVFAPLAAVLGPAEVAYRAQMASVFDHFGISRPVVFPRLSASYVPTVIREALERSSARVLVTDPSAFVREVGATFVDPDLDARIGAFRSSFDAERAALRDIYARVASDRALEKMDKRFADVQRRLDHVLVSAGGHGREAAQKRWPALTHLPDAFRRQGKAQERFLSMLDPILHEGSAGMEIISRAASAHVAAALDGDAAHIVYCG